MIQKADTASVETPFDEPIYNAKVLDVFFKQLNENENHKNTRQ